MNVYTQNIDFLLTTGKFARLCPYVSGLLNPTENECSSCERSAKPLDLSPDDKSTTELPHQKNTPNNFDYNLLPSILKDRKHYLTFLHFLASLKGNLSLE